MKHKNINSPGKDHPWRNPYKAMEVFATQYGFQTRLVTEEEIEVAKRQKENTVQQGF